MNRNLENIIESMGGLWHAVCRSMSVMAGSVLPNMTSERRLAGEPVYADSDDIDAVSYSPPEEWKQAGGHRIVSSQILKHAEVITGADWSAITLALHDDSVDRGLAEAALGMRIAKKTGWPRTYCQYICKRWGESRFKERYKGAVSIEYRIPYSHTVEELISLSGVSERTEIKRRSEIQTMLNDTFNSARDRLDQ